MLLLIKAFWKTKWKKNKEKGEKTENSEALNVLNIVLAIFGMQTDIIYKTVDDAVAWTMRYLCAILNAMVDSFAHDEEHIK